MGEDTLFCCGLGQNKASQFWPAKLVFAVLRKTLSMGSVQVYTQTKVVKEHREDGNSDNYVVEYEMEDLKEGETKTRGEIRCQKVVYAVNAWLPNLLNSRLGNIVKPVRGQVLATSPISDPVAESGVSLALGFEISDHGGKALKVGMEEETKEIEEKEKENEKSDSEDEDEEDEEDEELMYLIRRREDGRVVVGTRVPRQKGATIEELYDDNHVDDSITEKLVNMLEKGFPTMKREGKEREKMWKIEYVWQGIMGFTKDGLPLVGMIPEENETQSKNENEKENEKGEKNGRYVLAGFNGDGMAKCFASGKVISEMISGKLQPHEFLASFQPNRFF